MGESDRQRSWRERAGLRMHRELDNRLSPLGVWAYRTTKGGITRPWSADVLALTTTGRRSGRKRTVLLQYFGGDQEMIVAAANGGSDSHPGWYHNLTADPTAEVEIGERRMTVEAVELSSEEASAWWKQIVRKDPGYRRYSRATDRTIPVLRLVPR